MNMVTSLRLFCIYLNFCIIKNGISELLFSHQLAEALLEYGKASHHKVFDILGPNFDAIDYKMIGASDEQLDVFNEVWYIVLLNTGHTYEAIEAIEKRVKQREGVPFLWHLLERAYSMEGRPDASFASTKAKALEVAYFK
uniref:Tetratricopeptide repeat protein 38 n=1 Tax=Anthurium amnicola TaxID=1678845 RepID=A0A1D1XK03_9ARAE